MCELSVQFRPGGGWKGGTDIIGGLGHIAECWDRHGELGMGEASVRREKCRWMGRVRADKGRAGDGSF